MSSTVTSFPSHRPVLGKSLLFAGLLLVLAVLTWQAVTSHGTPDPTLPQTSRSVASLNISVLVFREGLECILVLCAITASMTGERTWQRRPVAAGVGVGFLASVATWFVALGIMSKLMESVPALHLQAATGLLAVVVLLVIMNWFFHKVYWGGWIGHHHRRKKAILEKDTNHRAVIIGLALLGFTSFYREGFEIVLFLQTYQLRLGSSVVLEGTLFGGLLCGIVAVLTFALQKRLPYRKMLVLTGVLLGAVLLVMVGEQAQEMQLAHWLPTTQIAALEKIVPGWMGMWFAVFPTVETLAAQALAAVLVIGSYFGARRLQAATGR